MTSRVIVYQGKRKSEVTLYRHRDKNTDNIETIAGAERNSSTNSLRRNRKKPPKVSIVVLRIISRVVIFIPCRLAFYTYLVLNKTNINQEVSQVLLIVSHSSILTNPILYVTHLSKFKEAYRRLLLKK